jgi:SAM-dependent methyltransferase
MSGPDPARGVRAAASFRDPFGHVFTRDGIVYRRIEPAGAPSYDRLLASGLKDELVRRGWLVDHVEVEPDPGAHRVLRPDRIPVLSWPYEWPFGALRAAALLTLDVARTALEHGLVLRDASAYNVQFRGAMPVFIDTLSFGEYREGEPWVAYGQFCRHFLAPLALMSFRDARLAWLLRAAIDGIPLELARQLLPWSALARPGILVHLHLHARYGGRGPRDAEAQIALGNEARRAHLSKSALLGMLESLRSTVSSLSWTPSGTTWATYYSTSSYADVSLAAKESAVRDLVERCPDRAMVWDLGSNTGRMLAAALPGGSLGVALDSDPAAVEIGWREANARGDTRTLHLVQDLVNPSPTQGWAQSEREGLAERGPADVVLALALVHHLAIGNNVSLRQVADLLARLGRNAIVEFVPKRDGQVVRMLSGREDVFANYDEEGFESAMRTRFDVEERIPIPATERSLWRLSLRPELRP